MSTAPHKPVLLSEVLNLLAPRAGGNYVDGTFGAGGYARAILEAADCRVWGIDRDPGAIARGAELARRFAGRLVLIEGRFGEMTALLSDRGLASADGIALDLGVSSMQLDEAERGFSFRADGPLDMRMGSAGESAADIVNQAPEKDLADILFRYGEERRARAIAKAIVKRRATAPFRRTGELAEIVRGVLGRRGKDAIDPATRSFQALRIAVNDELGELDRGLARRRGDAETRRPARRRHLPLAGGPAGEGLHPSAQRPRARALAPSSRRRAAGTELPALPRRRGDADGEPKSRPTRDPGRRASGARNGARPPPGVPLLEEAA